MNKYIRTNPPLIDAFQLPPEDKWDLTEFKKWADETGCIWQYARDQFPIYKKRDKLEKSLLIHKDSVYSYASPGDWIVHEYEWFVYKPEEFEKKFRQYIHPICLWSQKDVWKYTGTGFGIDKLTFSQLDEMGNVDYSIFERKLQSTTPSQEEIERSFLELQRDGNEGAYMDMDYFRFGVQFAIDWMEKKNRLDK